MKHFHFRRILTLPTARVFVGAMLLLGHLCGTKFSYLEEVHYPINTKKESSFQIASEVLLQKSYTKPQLVKLKNEVIKENSLQGTSSWLLRKPALKREIEGYASATSIQQGETIDLFVNTAADTFLLEVFRTGWYNGMGGRLIHGPLAINGTKQAYTQPDDVGLIDLDWKNPHRLETNSSWTTGVYLCRLTENTFERQSYIIFVVRNDRHTPDVLFQLPVTTYQAYNFWGGKSTYTYGSGDSLPWGSSKGEPARKVSFNRPYARSTNINAAQGMGAGEYLTNVQPVISSAGWDYNTVRWLEREGYDVSYITNLDTHSQPPLLKSAKVFLSSGHDEYWSWQMRDNVEAARDSGTSLVFLSSNAAYWQIRFESRRNQTNRVMVCWKGDDRDPVLRDNDTHNDRLATTLFREHPVDRPEGALIGVQYLHNPVMGDIVVSNASHAVFENTNLTNGDTLFGLLGYEADSRQGHEPNNTITLATSPFWMEGSGKRFSHMTIYEAESGSFVFATGSMQWSWGLDNFNAPFLRPAFFSKAAQQMTKNVFSLSGVLN